MEEKESALAPYRVLDLTDERGFLCGKLFAGLGADVIKVEPPGGDPGRNTPPFYKDIPDPERSLFWFAFNTGKRSVTLDIETADGREVLRKLATTADFLVESFPPGYLDGLGIGYSALSQVNPRLIMGSITPFGQNGPYAGWKGPDIIPWAMGGYMWMTGEPGRAPVRISCPPQTYLHASAMTAVGLLLALCYRQMTGEGQHVDTSAQQCPTWMLTHTYTYWDLLKINIGRAGSYRHFGQVFLRTIWPCKDGYIAFMFAGGAIGAKGQRRIAELIDQAGMSDDWLRGLDWEDWNAAIVTQEEVDRVSQAFGQFFRTRTKAELLDEAVKSGIMLGSVNTVADIMTNPQLKARDYWEEVEHEDIGTTITYPGAPCKLTETPWRVGRRAPLIGEHNSEVFERELRLPGKQSGIVKNGKKKGKEAKRPLDGVRVLDFTATVLGPTVTRYLTDHGATVIRVESMVHLETTRLATPFAGGQPGINTSGYFATHNAGKLGISLDMRKPRARDVARRLVRWADIVIETFTPGIMERWGLGYGDLKRIKPDIIMVSSSLEGQTGPYALHRGYGMVSASMAGFFELTGWPDGEPIGPYSAYSDFVGWNFLLISILVALDYRSRTGKGQYIDQSHVESAAHFLSPAILDYNINGRVASRVGNRDRRAAPHGAYRCRGQDRWCAIAVTNNEEWKSFCQVIGSPDWTKAPRFATLSGRKENEDELDGLVEGWTVNHTPEEVMTMLQQAGVPAGMVENAEDLFRDPQLEYRHHFVPLDHAEMGSYRISSAVFRLSRCSNEPRFAAPLLGEHNEYVLKEILGMSDDEVADLVADGGLE